MEECESLDTEMMELQDFQSEANSQDDEDEVEELQNSLREVVQDQSVKPKLQCLMVDPSFSMVTVQSEDSGIVWETASSRCSTPWASETSSTSEAYSMEGSGAAGKITIVFDEEKVVRRRTRSGGRSSRLGDRLSRPGSSRSASALGVERPEMSEVSLPNVKPEKTPTEPDLEDIRNKDQQLFSLISEGYEILNIRVPSKLPTVDEEESTELQDNLSYLDQTPKIKSKNNHIWRQQQDDDMLQDEADLNNQEPSEQDSSQQAADTELSKTPTPKDSTGDIDYFEKFTLLDVGVPGDLAPQLEEEEAEKPEGTPQEEEQKPAKETATDSPTASEDSFVFVTDVEIVGEHLDEVFYGEGAPPGSLQRRDKAEGRGGKRMRRESQRSLKESGSVLFGSQETILTPIFISPGPPKIIDPILLEEPTAMSFMYSDLYEDALGERRTSDEEYSEAESVASEKSYKRRLSDSEETDGYLEKFTLKDETPAAEVEVEPETVEDEGDGRMMWPQNKFEMTGCLTRVIQEEGEDESETKEPKTLESSAEEKSEDLKPEATEEKVEKGEERAEEKEEIKLTEEEPVSEASQELALDEMKVQEVKQEGSTDEPLPETQQVDIKAEETQESEEHQRGVTPVTATEPITDTEQPDQIPDEAEKVAQAVADAVEETTVITPESIKIPEITTEPEILTEDAIADVEVMAPEDKVITEAAAEGSEDKVQDQLTLAETEASVVTSLKEAAEDTATVEVTTDSDSTVQAVVEVTEKALDEKEIQTQVQIDLKEVTSVEETEVQAAVVGEEDHGAKTASPESHVPELTKEADLVLEDKTEISSEDKDAKTDSDQKVDDIFELEQQQEEAPKDESATPAEESGVDDQEVVSVGDEVFVLVPKGQAVEMDIEVGQLLEKTSDVEAPTEPEGAGELPIAPESVMEVPDGLQAQNKETITESNLEVVVVEKSEIQDVIEAEKPEVIVKEAEKPEVVVIDKSEIQEITEAERPEVIVKEAEKPEVVVVDEAEKNEIAVVEEAEKTEVVLVKEEEKTEVFVVNESEIQDVIEAEKPEVIVKEAEKPEVVVVDEAEKNEIAVVEEAEKTEVVLVKEEEKTEVFVVNESEIQDVIEAEKPEVIVKEAEKPEVVVVDEAEKNEIAVVEEAEKTEVVVVKEAEKEEFVVVKGAEIQEVIEEEKPEFIVKEEEKPEVVVVKEAEKEEFVVVKDSEQEVILKDREKSDVFAFIEAEKPEIVVVKDLEKQEVVDKESETTDFVETEKTEYVQEEAKLRNEFDNRYSPLAPLEEVGIEEKKLTQEFEEDEGVFSPLRSSTPQLDLSSLHRDDLQRSDIPDTEKNTEQHEDIYKVEDVQERIILTADTSPEINVFREEQAEAVTEVAVEEFEYEMITEQDAKDMPQQEPQKDEEEPKAETVQKREERMEKEVKLEKRKEVFDLFPEEELIEADYEIIDEEEESQARQAAELQGLDWFCFTCGCLLSKDDRASGEHHSHEVTAVGDAFEGIKEKLGDWISELQGRSENIEDLVSELELGYNSVEDQCVECEATMQAQNDEMMALVMEQYNNMSISMEEEKKAKLEQLYDQIVSFQESIDSAKVTLDTTAREAETDARSPEEIQLRLKEALDSAMSLELGPRGLLVFEDYAKGNTSSSHLTQRKGIPVPQRPTLQVQEAGSASSTSVTVYWKVNPGDIIDCFQVYCMEDPQGAVSEEYRVTVKESYCVLEELEPDKTYKVWVMAVNYTGCSLPSERLRFRTAPSVPVINTELCTVMWDSTTLRWSAAKQTPEQTFTVEYCRQYELEGEGLRTISGIQSCEQRVLLQPNENYLFYIKAVNEAGASEQSEAALISTKGTKFRLLKATAHPALKLSADETTIHYAQDTPEKTLSADKRCPFILGELLPCTGQYYWETIVSGSTAYRLGVMSSSANRNSQLGENSASWCLQCIPTPSGCRYQLLHNDVHSSVFVIDMPERVGTLLDYQLGRLCFYNAQTGQLLGAFCQGFTQPCHPALALEMPGRLGISMVPEVPEFTKDS
ncbi:Hypothetical predicted protein [Xyrichtys novacula]|uniref:Cardiomyopathy-associated protein 5 n=1 Tax=Xyrichtys novacula TaxID=13765 RepID=A0AAV1G5Z3_XYRNO|nr:Hypothetical predicted protein [Xyrichtys novacula]